MLWENPGNDFCLQNFLFGIWKYDSIPGNYMEKRCETPSFFYSSGIWILWTYFVVCFTSLCWKQKETATSCSFIEQRIPHPLPSGPGHVQLFQYSNAATYPISDELVHLYVTQIFTPIINTQLQPSGWELMITPSVLCQVLGIWEPPLNRSSSLPGCFCGLKVISSQLVLWNSCPGLHSMARDEDGDRIASHHSFYCPCCVGVARQSC